VQSIIRVLHIVVYAGKITILFLGNINHGNLFLYILVIVRLISLAVQ